MHVLRDLRFFLFLTFWEPRIATEPSLILFAQYGSNGSSRPSASCWAGTFFEIPPGRMPRSGTGAVTFNFMRRCG